MYEACWLSEARRILGATKVIDDFAQSAIKSRFLVVLWMPGQKARQDTAEKVASGPTTPPVKSRCKMCPEQRQPHRGDQYLQNTCDHNSNSIRSSA